MPPRARWVRMSGRALGKSRGQIFEKTVALHGTIRALLARRLLDKFHMLQLNRSLQPMKAGGFAVKSGHLPTAMNGNAALNFANAPAFCDEHFRRTLLREAAPKSFLKRFAREI